jgi:hypothetical protein
MRKPEKSGLIMFYTVVVAFLVPWFLTIIFYKKLDKALLFTITPIGSVIAFSIDELGFYFGFWNIKPFYDDTMAELPFNLGLYSILAFLLISLIRKYRQPLITIISFTLLTTILEFIYLIIGRVEYGNRWNLGWTFVSYLVPYFLLYLYYNALMKINVLNKSANKN